MEVKRLNAKKPQRFLKSFYIRLYDLHQFIMGSSMDGVLLLKQNLFILMEPMEYTFLVVPK